MRHWLVCGLVLAGCGDDGGVGQVDAPRADAPAVDSRPDAAIDAPPDAMPDAPCDHVLFTGGIDAASQGWTVYSIQPVTFTLGADYTEIATSTPSGGESGGQGLLAKPGAVDPAMPFALQFVVERVSGNAHNQLDAPAALLASLTGQVGNQADRSAMVYLDAAAIGFSDDSQHAAFATTDGNYHTYVLASDGAGTLTVSADGTELLSRAGFATNGTIAVGDQTNDANYDATLRVKSVTLLCPP